VAAEGVGAAGGTQGGMAIGAQLAPGVEANLVKHPWKIEHPADGFVEAFWRFFVHGIYIDRLGDGNFLESQQPPIAAGFGGRLCSLILMSNAALLSRTPKLLHHEDQQTSNPGQKQSAR
jgi:hypothetical protein